MFKKYLTLFITIFVINLSLGASVFAKGSSDKEAEFAEKVKANITKLGTGIDAKVKLKLKDGTKLKGYISQINADSFVVVNEKSGATTQVSYSKAKQVKGNNLSTGVKVAIAIGVIFVVVLVIGLISFSP